MKIRPVTQVYRMYLGSVCKSVPAPISALAVVWGETIQIDLIHYSPIPMIDQQRAPFPT